MLQSRYVNYLLVDFWTLITVESGRSCIVFHLVLINCAEQVGIRIKRINIWPLWLKMKLTNSSVINQSFFFLERNKKKELLQVTKGSKSNHLPK